MKPSECELHTVGANPLVMGDMMHLPGAMDAHSLQ